MAYTNYTQRRPAAQDTLSELSAIFDNLDDSDLVESIREQRHNGRPGYSPRAMWRAYVASFVLNLASINELIRRLEDSPALRYLCGFGDTLPHRCTINRFVSHLAQGYHDLVEACFANITNKLKALLPDLGEEVAIDSTTVRSHCNPNRALISDSQASWTAKTTTSKAAGKREWHHGYKLHLVCDANHGLPLAQFVTTAKRNDSPELPKVMEKAKALYSWFKPSVALADRGYDATSNHEYLDQQGIIPVIPIRKKRASAPLFEGVYTKQGIPTCLGMAEMEYVGSDPEKGHLYRCRAEGCHLKNSNRGGILHCADETWEDPKQNLRLFGALRRDSKEWKALYEKRQAIERVFKSMKESRRLERHCVRGLRQITLHTMMSVMTFQATALVRVLAGQVRWLRWMVRRVA